MFRRTIPFVMGQDSKQAVFVPDPLWEKYKRLQLEELEREKKKILEEIENQRKKFLEEREKVLNLAKKEAERILSEAKRRAEALLANAKAQAEETVRQAKSEAETLKKEATDRGYREGFEKGYREGLKKGYGETEKIRKTAKKELEEAKREKERIIKSAYPAIAVMGIEVARKILGEELFAKTREVLLASLKRGLERVGNVKEIRVRLNPEDKHVLCEAIRRICGEEGLESEIVDDEKVPPGGCVLETPEGRIDVSIPSQLARIREVLLEIARV